MEKEPIKVLDINKEISGDYLIRFEGDLTGLPKKKVMEAIEKAINKVKPLDIPTL